MNQAPSREPAPFNVAAADPPQTGSSDWLVRLIERRGAEIASTALALESMTEREILACGQVLSEILARIKKLIAEKDSSVAAAMERTERVTGGFIQDVESSLEVQGTAVADLARRAGDIKNVMESIRELTRTSNLLALNAKIESARLGESGTAFGIIADQLRQLSVTIAQSSKSVDAAAAAVLEGIPGLRANADGLLSRTHQFIAQMQEQATANGPAQEKTGETDLTSILRLSNQALSHLQIQDPLAQKLAGIRRSLEALSEQARRGPRGGNTSGPADDPPADDGVTGDTTLAAGAVNLF